MIRLSLFCSVLFYSVRFGLVCLTLILLIRLECFNCLIRFEIIHFFHTTDCYNLRSIHFNSSLIHYFYLLTLCLFLQQIDEDLLAIAEAEDIEILRPDTRKKIRSILSVSISFSLLNFIFIL